VKKPPRTYPKARTTAVHQVMRRRGNACLTAASILATFLAVFMCGAGGTWSSWHTWLTLTVAGTAGAALACYVAATLRAPKETVLAQLAPAPRTGDSPVTHPGGSHLQPAPVLTPSGQEK
jgi:hypothetical protein